MKTTTAKILNIRNFHKEVLPTGETKVHVKGAAKVELDRAKQVKALIEKVLAAGDDFIIGFDGQRMPLDQNSGYAVELDERWRDLASMRPGSESYNKSHGHKVHHIVTAYYPLLGITVYYNYLKQNSMFLCQSFIYLNQEIVPMFQQAGWYESLALATNTVNDVADLVINKTVIDMKTKFNMSMIDFQSTKDIQYRSYLKNIH